MLPLPPLLHLVYAVSESNIKSKSDFWSKNTYIFICTLYGKEYILFLGYVILKCIILWNGQFADCAIWTGKFSKLKWKVPHILFFSISLFLRHRSTWLYYMGVDNDHAPSMTEHNLENCFGIALPIFYLRADIQFLLNEHITCMLLYVYMSMTLYREVSGFTQDVGFISVLT